MGTLIERIGIDRSELSVMVESIDMEKITRQVAERAMAGQNDVVVSDNEQSTFIEIKNSEVGYFKYNRYKQAGRAFTTLGINVSDGRNNKQNMTAAEYRNRIKTVLDRLERCYGISVNRENVQARSLEINATFELEDDFEKYSRVIRLIMNNLPKETYGKDGKPVKYYEAADGEGKLETAQAQNSSVKLKIYNKGKQLVDVGAAAAEEHKLMRIEYTFKSFSSNDALKKVLALTDEMIVRRFMLRFEREFLKPYQNWKEKNHAELVDMVRFYRESSGQRWCLSFFLACYEYEVKNNHPVLLDIEDLKEVIKKLEPARSRNANAKYENIRKQVEIADFLFGDRKRLEEIFMKVEKMYLMEEKAAVGFLGKAKKEKL